MPFHNIEHVVYHMGNFRGLNGREAIFSHPQGVEPLPLFTRRLCKTTDIIMGQFVFTKNSLCLNCGLGEN